MHTFSAEDLKEAGTIRELPPFAVITSSEVEPEDGRYVVELPGNNIQWACTQVLVVDLYLFWQIPVFNQQ